MKRLLAAFATVFLSICWFTLPSRGEPVTKTTGRASQSQALLPSLAHEALLQHKLQQAANQKLWYETVLWNEAKFYAQVLENERIAKAKADAEAEAKRKAKQEVSRSVRPGFIGDRIANCEGGLAYLHRDHGPESTASGKYGFLDGTWDGLDNVKGNGFKGYRRAMDAPESVQDEGFVILWNDGKGAGHWSQSKKCWG